MPSPRRTPASPRSGAGETSRPHGTRAILRSRARVCRGPLGSSLRNDDDVAWAYEEVLLLRAIGDLPVVERDAGRRPTALTTDDDPIPRGEVREALSQRDRFEHRHRAFERVAS